jgi:molybdenum cofactor synthesis domain-containing protein
VTRSAVVITISDSVHAGTREDSSGPAVAERLRQLGWAVQSQVLPDEPSAISARLCELADKQVPAVFTTGGTGIAARDTTPEATRSILDKEIPGLAEWMRIDGRQFTARSLLSRGVTGTRGRTFIANLPGSPKGALQSLNAIADLVPHVIDLLEGNTEHAPLSETAPRGRTSEE